MSRRSATLSVVWTETSAKRLIIQTRMRLRTFFHTHSWADNTLSQNKETLLPYKALKM